MLAPHIKESSIWEFSQDPHIKNFQKNISQVPTFHYNVWKEMHYVLWKAKEVEIMGYFPSITSLVRLPDYLISRKISTEIHQLGVPSDEMRDCAQDVGPN